ncbi:MAG: glutamine synthetase [Burkholderiales bacterium]|nr:glutamine synthetase [Burkholderiales bacterium]
MSNLDHQAVADLFAKHGTRYVECIFPDINGIPRGKMVRAEDFLAGKALHMAEAVVLRTVNGDYPDDDVIGFADHDIVMVPDLSTVRVLPWKPTHAVAIHDCVTFEGELSQFAPRSMLKNVLSRYAAKGWTPVVAPEIEFYLYARDGNFEHGFNLPPFRGGHTEANQSGFTLDGASDLSAFWDELFDACEQLGLRTDTWLHEEGRSQFEINLWHGNALKLADDVVFFKYALREVAARHGLYAVFMAKPVADEPGSSMHLHQSIVDHTGHNIFSLPDGGESPAFHAFLGGLQRYVPEFMVFFAPYQNSWRRYLPGTQAPVNLEWAYDNRTVALRSPRATPAARRIENRLPGSDANPYLAIAASLACGLLGMEEGLKARPPLEESGYNYPRELPASFDGALARLMEGSKVREVFGEIFATSFTAVKELEHAAYLAEVSAWDRRFLTLNA